MAQTMLRIPLTGGSDPDPRFVQSNMAKGPLDTAFDIRDFLNHAVGGNYTSLADQDIRGSYKQLAQRVGEPMAQKLFTHAFLFNQNNKQGKPEDRVRAFYEASSNDPDVAKVLLTTKGLGYGSREGFNASNNANVTNLGGYKNMDAGMYDKGKILLKVAKK